MTLPWNVSWHHTALQIPSIWSMGITGDGVTVALLDTGLSAPRGLDRLDFEYLDARGSSTQPADFYGHGTAAGSTIASYLGGALGIAPHAKLVSLTVLDTADSAADVESALTYLLGRADIDVVSCSFVMTRASAAVRKAVRELTNSGKVVIAAAGDAQTEMEFPDQTADAFTVAAVDANLRALQGARTAPWIDIAAPGFDIPVVLPGTGRMGRFSESSAAAAVVSGVAALALSLRPAGAERQALARGLGGLFKMTATPLSENANAVGSGLVAPTALLQRVRTST